MNDRMEKVKNGVKAAVLVPAGLMGFEKGLPFPDKDISYLGIGAHRYFLFHSAATVFVVGKLHQHVRERFKEDNGLSARIGRKIFGVVCGSVALGMGVHLLLDVFEPKAVMFPLIGSLVHGTLVDDRLWLLGNSMYCFKAAHDMYAVSMGEDLQKAKRFVFSSCFKISTDFTLRIREAF